LDRFKKIFLNPILLLLLLPVKSFAQELLVNEPPFGLNLAVNMAFGTHFQRFGVNLNFYFIKKQFQANSEIRLYYSFKNLGPKFINPELVLAQGVVFGYGSIRNEFNPFINSVSNQTNYSNSVAYSYNVYINPIRTAQRTGIFALQFNRVTLIAENDLLAKPALDRFRTAAFLIQYQHNNQFQAAINCTMWTGMMGKKKYVDHSKFYYDCYMDTTGGMYHGYSHGLLSAQVKYNVGWSQNVQLNTGVDAEQVRNAVQNKFIHDMRWIPKKWNKSKNCHIPMLDEHGQQYLYLEGQKIRKPKLYLNLFSNAGVFY
jgi:hypothetical protein